MKNTPDHTPPRLAERFLLWFLRSDLAEEVLGDLDEKFFQTTEKHSVKKAEIEPKQDDIQLDDKENLLIKEKQTIPN